jgi:hypothetical protein
MSKNRFERTHVLANKLKEIESLHKKFETKSHKVKVFFFYTDCKVEDDDFFMYAALRSGPNTIVVTNDYLNNQRVFLDEWARLFKRWLLNRRVNVQRHTINLTFPPKFDVRVSRLQGGEGTSRWVVPFFSDMALSSISYIDLKFVLLNKNV